MKKIVRKDNSKRKKILSICLVLFLFMGIGYSVISSNLMFNGNIQLSKYESPYLYDVLKKEALSGGLAQKYTGEHHDSFTEEPSKDIYHWYATTNNQGIEVQNKNNVLFAGHCWHMVRTTDTGGVKMIYNGEADNGQCLDTRPGNIHIGYSSTSHKRLSSNIWYGSDYTYDSISNTFSISGDTEQLILNESNYENVVGKYTCFNTNLSDTCSSVNLVYYYEGGSDAYVLTLSANVNNYSLGKVQFANFDDPTGVGYMHGEKLTKKINPKSSQSFGVDEELFISFSNSNYYNYSDQITYDPTTNLYSLVDPMKPGAGYDYIGKYTFGSTFASESRSKVYYIVKNSIAILLEDGKLVSDYEPFVFGNNIIDNGDDTFTLDNTESITLSDLHSNYNNYKNKYTCGGSSVTCAQPKYVYSLKSTGFSYVPVWEKLLIAKGHDGSTLQNTLLVRKEDYVNNKANYSDYIFTCNTLANSCPEDELRFISNVSTPGYSYLPNYYFGNSVTWDGTKYTLVDSIGVENIVDRNNMSTHHFFCLEPGSIQCSSVGYIYYYTGVSYGENMYYFLLENGETSLENVINEVFKTNTYNSVAKELVDKWYSDYMLDSSDYLEDVIFCNNRKIINFGGWNPNGGSVSSYLKFDGYSSLDNLDCDQVTDQFSVNNSAAQLTYKVGLLTANEVNLLDNDFSIRTNEFWYLTPSYIGKNELIRYFRNPDSSIGVTSSAGLRPVISLKPKTEFVTGNGSKENPYVVKPVKERTYNGELVQGAEYVDGQYTYRYMQEWNWDESINSMNWVNINEDGWGVRLTDLTSTDPVTTKLCTSISNKPIVSMSGMFFDSQATSIDLSSFDTSNVVNMKGMFFRSQATSLDLRYFNTSKVTNMNSMFAETLLTTIDLSSFDTSNVSYMTSMFAASHITELDLSSFDIDEDVLMEAVVASNTISKVIVKNDTIAELINNTYTDTCGNPDIYVGNVLKYDYEACP